SLKFAQQNIYNHLLKLILSTGFIMVAILINYVSAHCQSPNLSQGSLLSIDGSNGTKGLILPKVALTDLAKYSPILGKQVNGLVVQNTNVDVSNGLVKGIYI